MRYIIVSLFLVLFLADSVSIASAQQTVADPPRQATKTQEEPTVQKDSVAVQKSPRGAMLRSLFVPGWGQLYNGKWLKAIVIAGAEIGLIANAIIQNQLAVQATNIYEREFYQNNRGLSLWWLGGVILYSMADAYVDAQLYNFDESPDLSVNLYRTPGSGNSSSDFAFRVSLKIHL